MTADEWQARAEAAEERAKEAIITLVEIRRGVDIISRPEALVQWLMGVLDATSIGTSSDPEAQALWRERSGPSVTGPHPGAGGGDDEGHMHADVLATQTPEFRDAYTGCVVNPVMSCVCSRGTKSCIVIQHVARSSEVTCAHRCGVYLGDNDGTCPQLACVRAIGHAGAHDNVTGDHEVCASCITGREDNRRTNEVTPADELRALGWAVAVHNDYRMKGEPHTFWLFTKGDRAVKGEGRTDAEALAAVRSQVADGDLDKASPEAPYALLWEGMTGTGTTRRTIHRRGALAGNVVQLDDGRWAVLTGKIQHDYYEAEPEVRWEAIPTSKEQWLLDTEYTMFAGVSEPGTGLDADAARAIARVRRSDYPNNEEIAAAGARWAGDAHRYFVELQAAKAYAAEMWSTLDEMRKSMIETDPESPWIQHVAAVLQKNAQRIDSAKRRT